MKKELFIQKLREKGLKATPQRIAVIEAFERFRGLHPSAFQIHAEAKRKVPKLSLSTTYATIKELARLHLIKTLQFDRTENRYESDLTEHINLICGGCGCIIDYEIPDPAVRAEVARRTGFQITESRLEFYGLCRACAEKKRHPASKKSRTKSS